MAQKQYELKTSPVHLLRRCSQFADDLFDAETRGSDLTPRQLTVLIAADAQDGASQTALVTATGIDRSTLADIVARMIQRDLLARRRTEADARANAVRVTAKGNRALKNALGAMKKVEKRLLAKIPAARRTEFLKHLILIAAQADGE
ncbi:MAG: winged helix-turn-helix transcriptional regulator [Alphaproteobacteria bacterium]|nr:winged helix-turn-helix transcriptional regulator [Alphaproteobacteria bacterium]